MDWKAFIVAICALTLWGATIAYSSRQERHDKDGNPDSQKETISPVRNDGRITSTSGPMNAAKETNPSDERAEHLRQITRQSNAAVRQANAAFITAWIAAIALAASIVAGGGVWFTYQEARRQADAAEKVIPRSWLYVELPTREDFLEQLKSAIDVPWQGCSPPPHFEMNFPPFKCVDRFDNKDGTRSYALTLQAFIHNYGQIPATVKSAEGYLFFTPDPNKRFPSGEIPFTAEGNLERGIVCVKSSSIENLNGAMIGAGHKIETPEGWTFVVRNQVGSQNFGFFVVWIWLIIKYNDPYGVERETGYMVKIHRGNEIGIVNRRYTYNDNPNRAWVPRECMD